ncbi:MAG: hypothetical protein COX57_12045 [Alphaproteobacteria bacterium CG_4_10_14_0_2_um_filter_63_37]|nr:MAG: hypothetical protein AUJ55_09530 [Proteobacteria bacterium CG1_02_64_396]PJA23708.1 MAG: hypothetical protein COX57_12045 [Alphaproteobacteria bacterium CG_4_10_14_0_2_um_filter_63_37]
MITEDVVLSATQYGKKYTCYQCHQAFYDLNPEGSSSIEAICPVCNANQKDAPIPAYMGGRRRKVVLEEAVAEVEDKDDDDEDLDVDADLDLDAEDDAGDVDEPESEEPAV